MIHTPSEFFCWFCFLILLTKKKDSTPGGQGWLCPLPFPARHGWGAQVVTASGQVVPGLWGRSGHVGEQQTRGSQALPAGAQASALAQVSPLPPPGVTAWTPRKGMAGERVTTQKTHGSAGGLASWLGGFFFARGPRSAETSPPTCCSQGKRGLKGPLQGTQLWPLLLQAAGGACPSSPLFKRKLGCCLRGQSFVARKAGGPFVSSDAVAP